ncbi:hypothetical protein E1285_12180 [Actinomadura sp. 7K507]|nr:hypothetical protein E1285_12180 [Actinomadura sp. 7K507]
MCDFGRQAVPADRCRQRDPDTGNDVWYSGRKHRHGGNVQFLADATGEPLWPSPAEPGSVADITAARRRAIKRWRSPMDRLGTGRPELEGGSRQPEGPWPVCNVWTPGRPTAMFTGRLGRASAG